MVSRQSSGVEDDDDADASVFEYSSSSSSSKCFVLGTARTEVLDTADNCSLPNDGLSSTLNSGDIDALSIL